LVDKRALKFTVASTGTAAILGNAFIGKDAMRWFKQLRRPKTMVTMPVFYAVGAVYYMLMGTVLYRSIVRRNRRAVSSSLTVLVANEVWNVLFFGRRSTRNGFIGIAAFLVPLGVLYQAVDDDDLSQKLVAAYGLWVVYDAVWTFGLWRLNPED
jgi:tryptophan-rich sensory protein